MYPYVSCHHIASGSPVKAAGSSTLFAAPSLVPEQCLAHGRHSISVHAAQGAFHSSSSPEAPHPLGAVGIVSLRLLQRNCQDLEAVGRCGGEDTPVHGTGLIDWHILPTSLSPETVHPRHSACLGFRDTNSPYPSSLGTLSAVQVK